MDFFEVIQSKIDKLHLDRTAATEKTVSPDFHVTRVKDMVEYVSSQLDEISEDLTKEDIIFEIKSVLSQFPEFVESGWSNATTGVQMCDREIKELEEMRKMYSDWQESQLKDEEAKAEKKPKPKKAKEPSVKKAFRKAGGHPGVKLKDFRSAKGKKSSSEDSEA